MIVSLCIFQAKGTYRPAEIVTIHRKVGNRIMDSAIFGETIALTSLSGISMPIGGVFPFEEGGIDRFTDRRSPKRFFYASSVPKTMR